MFPPPPQNNIQTWDMSVVVSRGRMVRLGGWEEWGEWGVTAGVVEAASSTSTSGVTTVVAGEQQRHAWPSSHTIHVQCTCVLVPSLFTTLGCWLASPLSSLGVCKYITEVQCRFFLPVVHQPSVYNSHASTQSQCGSHSWPTLQSWH